MDLFLVLGAVEFLRKAHATVIRAFERLQIIMGIHMKVELGGFVSINILVAYLTEVYLKFLLEFEFIIILVLVDFLDYKVLFLIFLKNLRYFFNNFLDSLIFRNLFFNVYKLSENSFIYQILVSGFWL